jgi:hypothetical protein
VSTSKWLSKYTKARTKQEKKRQSESKTSMETPAKWIFGVLFSTKFKKEKVTKLLNAR